MPWFPYALGGTDVFGVANVERTVHFVYHSAGDLFYMRSLDEGRTWAAPVDIGDGAPQITHPISAEGQSVHVVYQGHLSAGARKDNIYHRRSTDGGATWSSETQIHAGASGKFYRYAVKVLDGIVHVGFVQHDDVDFTTANLYYRRSLDNGVTWETLQEPYTSSVNPSRPSLDVEGSTVHMTWVDMRGGGVLNEDGQVYHGRSLDSGVSWQTETARTSGARQALRSDVVCSDNACLLAWQQSHDGTLTASTIEIYTSRSTDDGATWGSNTRMTNSVGISEHAFPVAHGSRISLIWVDYRSGPGETWMLRSTDDGATWATEELVAATGDPAPRALITPNFLLAFFLNGTPVEVGRNFISDTYPRIVDYFDRADNTDLGADWASDLLAWYGGGAVDPDIVSNQAKGVAAGYSDGHWTPFTLPSSCYVGWQVVAKGADIYSHVLLLLPTGGGTAGAVGYIFVLNDTAGQVRVARTTTSVETDIIGPLAQVVLPGDWLRLDIDGSLIKGWYSTDGIEWTLLGSATDTTYRSDSTQAWMELVQNSISDNFMVGAPSAVIRPDSSKFPKSKLRVAA